MAIRLFSEVLIIFVHFILEHLLPPLAEPTEQYGRVCASCTASTAVQLAGFETLPTSAIAGTSPRMLLQNAKPAVLSRSHLR
ncbi:hypothetical protein F5J12DRAFT_802326 [Pisolithus orientalis]|uniref:uncharacterized protein n=1 Tax=Pisolithus orientalis TaxID=936130 RepID=UPI00222449EF|nr:uncharacterized protein F5J12DRAFT_802326 [Pisolithus orientalis]KAI6030707.1 hypothetical protein F5J12DRAFT_802326 [Pisolithus orientalis]